MTRYHGVKNRIVGKAKQLAGEVLADERLREKGKLQEQEGESQKEESGELKPLRESRSSDLSS
jgi:uncharacterized protein YjbJ (UPF0337 family)